MPNKLWDEMTVDEKLEWLHAAIRGFKSTGNANADRLDARHDTIIRRLDAVAAEVNTVTTEVRQLQRKNDTA
jgi:hypothetical protein